jgi:hypothetical protein
VDACLTPTGMDLLMLTRMDSRIGVVEIAWSDPPPKLPVALPHAQWPNGTDDAVPYVTMQCGEKTISAGAGHQRDFAYGSVWAGLAAV